MLVDTTFLHIDTHDNDIQHNDIQHNDIQHNDIQHNRLRYGTPRKRHSVQKTLNIWIFIMLNAVMLSVVLYLLL